MSATPRPWLPFAYQVIRSENDELAEQPIARFGCEDDRDLALRAVNAHDELVAALEAIVLQTCQGPILERDACIAQARAALAAARGEPA